MLRIDGVQCVAHGGERGRFLGVDASNEAEVSCRLLLEREIELRLRYFGQTPVLHVADDADDGHPRVRVRIADAADAKATADGTLSRPIASRHRLVHEDDERRRRPVGSIERPAAHEADAHRIEVVPGNRPVVCRRAAGRRPLMSFDHHADVKIALTEWQVIDGAGVGDTGNRDEPGEALIHEPPLRRVVAVASGGK